MKHDPYLITAISALYLWLVVEMVKYLEGLCPMLVEDVICTAMTNQKKINFIKSRQ